MHPPARPLLLVFAAAGLVSPRAACGQDPVAAEIRRLLAGHHLTSSVRPELAGQDTLLGSLYAARGDSALWLAGTTYGERGRAAIVVLNAAAERGLDPRDYDARTLDSLADLPDDTTAAGLAARDLLLSAAVARYLRDLKDGRVPQTPFDRQHQLITATETRALLNRVAQGEPVEELAREVEPHLAQYHNLLLQLAKYRSLADTFRYRPLRRTPTRPGERYIGTAELRRRLVAVGDLAADAPRGAAGRYDSTLVAAVRRFQGRHALDTDGVLGPATFDALAVPPAHRVRQISLALERLRWLPRLDGLRLIVVNIPAFELFAFDTIGGTGAPLFRMRVALGTAYDHETPVLLEPLREVRFRPYWNVPRKILTSEVLPLIAQDPGYLRKMRMQVVGARDTVLGDSADARLLRGLTRGWYRVRQLPGPWNALGLTKFTFPNRADVYLHGTPDTLAFHRARRDVSHGCIRVQDPAALAEWVLRGSPGWTRAAIDSARNGVADTVRAEVALPTTVVLFYTTAVASPEGGVWFYQDIYGHDAELTRALRVSRAAGTPPRAP